MSRQTLDLVRTGFDAMSRADFDTLRMLFQPDVEWHDQRDLPGSTVHLGIEAVLCHFESVMADLADYRADVDAVEEAADGRVIARCRFSGVGRASGASVDRPAVVVFELRESKIARGDIFAERAGGPRSRGGAGVAAEAA